MEPINNIVFPFNKNTHITVLNSNKNNSRYNKINHFSSRDSTNSLKENNKIISPDYKNLYISTPLTTTRNNYYKSNRIIPSHILNDNPLNNITNSLILNKLSKNRNYNNNLRIKTFNNNKTSYIFKMNNRYFSENLKINNNTKVDKNYTNLLITKMETQLPLTTYYFSPTKRSSNFSSSNLFLNYYKERNDEVGHRSESENNIFFPRPKSFNKCNYLRYTIGYRKKSDYDINHNEFKNKNFNKYKSAQKLKCNKCNFETFYKFKGDIKKIKYFINILKNLAMKKILNIKKIFFLRLYCIFNNQIINQLIINNTDNNFFKKEKKYNKTPKENKTFPTKVKILFKHNTNILNKKKRKEIYIPNNTKNNDNIHDTNINNPKTLTLKFQNNYNLKRDNLNKNNVKENSLYHVKKTHKTNIFYLNNFNEISLNNKILSDRNMNKKYSKNINNNNLSTSLGKIYQKKKLDRNLKNQKCSNKSNILSNIINIQINNSYDKKNNNLFFKTRNTSREKNNFINNNGMLATHIISNDQKLYITVKYVILINKRKNNTQKSSFIKSNLKVNKICNLNIVKNQIDEKQYKNEIKIFFNFLKVKSFYMRIKKYIFLIVLKKIKNSNNKTKIIDYSENLKLIRVKKLTKSQKLKIKNKTANINKYNKNNIKDIRQIMKYNKNN